MKIAVVTDSTAYLSAEQVKENNIHVVPIPFTVDGQTYREGVDITTTDFYAKLRTAREFPKTSQPPVGELLSLYEELGKQGYDTVISIHLAGTISGLVATLESVKDQVPGVRVIPFDSRITVILMGMLAVKAARMANAGKSADEIIAALTGLRDTIGEYFVVDDLQNLVRGGRLSNTAAFIGSVLKIKPLLTFDEQTDEIVGFEKVRSTKKALKRAEALFAERMKDVDYPLHLFVIHANDPEMAAKWQHRLQKQYPDYPVDISYFGPVIGTHLGEKALALAWMRDIDK